VSQSCFRTYQLYRYLYYGHYLIAARVLVFSGSLFIMDSDNKFLHKELLVLIHIFSRENHGDGEIL